MRNSLARRMDVVSPPDLEAVLAAYGIEPVAGVTRLGAGLIHDTFELRDAKTRYVLQRVNPIFSPSVHDNIHAVTEHLAVRGLATPRLIPTRTGERCVVLERSVWRLMTYVPGVSFSTIEDVAQAHAAAGLLARFHNALGDLEHRFSGARAGVHDTGAHLQRLRLAVAEHGDHRLAEPVARLSDAIHRAADGLPHVGLVPSRIVHGDPKLDNVLFAGEKGPSARDAICLVDLDTVGPMALHLELGDCLRSWCNTAGENATEAVFDRRVHNAVITAYASQVAFSLAPAEVPALVAGVEWITLELAVRFATDALEERYFGWDRRRFAAAGEHNLARARVQWGLHERVVACRSERESAVERAFAPA